jgi:hypothetical protein
MLVAHLILIVGVMDTIEPKDGTPVSLGFLCGALGVIGWYVSGHRLVSTHSHWLPVGSFAHLLIISLIRRKHG